jgi:hypothetical protein
VIIKIPFDVATPECKTILEEFTIERESMLNKFKSALSFSNDV